MKVIRVPALLACIVLLLACLSADAATYTVTNAADVNFGGTLRWAINSANANGAPDVIGFSTNLGASVITPTGQLPYVTGSRTVIDATTNAGYSGTPFVRIHAPASGVDYGLVLNADQCMVKGLAISRFRQGGIFIQNVDNCIVQNCYLMTNGSAGVTVAGSFNVIGGTNALQRNVISANTNGVYLSSGWSNNTVIGNFIGLDPTGTLTNGNRQIGIAIDGSAKNRIGSITNGARNIISANGGPGIQMRYSNSFQNIVENNYIGTDTNGTAAFGNVGHGILIFWSWSNRVGGTSVSQRNVICGNQSGVRLESGASDYSFGNVIQGNYIGISATGGALSNRTYGIHLQYSPSNTIGGAVSGAGNVIAGGQYGIYLEGTNTCGTIIQGNKIGTDPSGSNARKFTSGGIALGGSRYTQVGGTNEFARNLICGSMQSGVTTADDQGGYHVIEGNYVGVDLGGTRVISNALSGIALNVPYCRIGGTNASQRNVISGNGTGITLAGTNTHHAEILGNYIGVDVTGLAALGGQVGIQLYNVRNCEIGRGDGPYGNVIAGMSSDGIYLGSGCAENRIRNNFIGVDATGNGYLGNSGSGIYIMYGGPTNYIGGSSANTEGNVIAGSGVNGIYASYCTGLMIRANCIGLGSNLSVVGNASAGIRMNECREFGIGGSSVWGNWIGGNGLYGVYLYTGSTNGYVSDNYIGALMSGSVVSNASHGIYQLGGSHVDMENNLISANGGDGIRLVQCSQDEIDGNRIGTDAAGTLDLGNMGYGIYVEGPGASNVIGGLTGNVISGNERQGIFLNGPSLTGNRIVRNYIGTDATGSIALSNRQTGVAIYASSQNLIGDAEGFGNIISGNGDVGINIGGPDTYGNRIKCNYIGTDGTGAGAIPNGDHGVYFGAGASNNYVGGTGNEDYNVIAFNRGDGVNVVTDSGNLIAGNWIKRNGGLGIDLGSGGVTANDGGEDTDTGANGLQNFPVLLSASNDGAMMTLVGTLNSGGSASYAIEFFGSRDPDLTGYGEGEFFYGRSNVTTSAGGTVGFTATVSTVAYVPNFVTATATALGNNDTSEFSQRLFVDSDGDGMGDGYESEYFGSYTAGDPQSHADTDGIDNLGEFLAETDPTDAGSCTRIAQFWRESWGDYGFIIPASDCRNYTVEFAWDFTRAPGSIWWDWSGFDVVRTNGLAVFTSGDTGFEPTFFRVIANIP